MDQTNIYENNKIIGTYGGIKSGYNRHNLKIRIMIVLHPSLRKINKENEMYKE